MLATTMIVYRKATQIIIHTIEEGWSLLVYLILEN